MVLEALDMRQQRTVIPQEMGTKVSPVVDLALCLEEVFRVGMEREKPRGDWLSPEVRRQNCE